MKARSTIIPPKFKIGDRKGNLIEVAFFDDVKEIQDQEEEATSYEYSVYKIKIIYREKLEESIENNYEAWLELAKDTDYQELVLDRIGLDLPEDINATNLLVVVKTLFENLTKILRGDWAKYRQELRDITKQKGFPYDVEFPKKPEE